MFRIDLAIFTFYVVMYYRKKCWRWTFLGSVSVNLLVHPSLDPWASNSSLEMDQQDMALKVQLIQLWWMKSNVYVEKCTKKSFYMFLPKWSASKPESNIWTQTIFESKGSPPVGTSVTFRPLTLRCLQWMPRQTASCSLRRMSLPQHLDDEHHQIHGQRPTSSRNLEHLDISR